MHRVDRLLGTVKQLALENTLQMFTAIVGQDTTSGEWEVITSKGESAGRDMITESKRFATQEEALEYVEQCEKQFPVRSKGGFGYGRIVVEDLEYLK